MEISVIICTYNRSHHLRNVLQSLFEQIVPDNLKWDIIVVDNNSTDDTYNVVKTLRGTSPVSLTYIKEEKQGLSHARNRGITESKGKYIAFTDDDAIVDRYWVADLYETFNNYNCDCVGGRIYLKPLKKLPVWLKLELWGFLAYLDYGDKPFQISNHFIYGTNMAFTRDILNKVGYFNTELGRVGYTPLGGEETELIQKVKNSGGKIIYQPAAIVHHVIGLEKLNKQHFRKLHYYSGVISGRFFNEPIKRHINGIPLFVFLHFFKSLIKYFKFPSVRLQMNVWWHLGFMKGRSFEHKDRAGR